MIEIELTRTGNRAEQVVVKGHGGGAAGSDIVCAAVSAVTETALAGLLHYDREGTVWEMEDGYIFIRVRDASVTTVDAILTTLILGLKQIAKEYPDKATLRLVEDAGITDET
jgi:uncharacterized protein YsxB (DUF464 family)